jgi:citrate synthase
MLAVAREGLEGIVVTSSEICAIDGQRGSIQYRGVDIGALAKHSTFEETVYLLWYGELPGRSQLEAFTAKLGSKRELDEHSLAVLRSLAPTLEPMDVLRTVVSALAGCDLENGDRGWAANVNKAMHLTAKVPTIVAHCQRHPQHNDQVRPDPTLTHAANFLYMLRGERGTELQERAMDTAMILMADHELNASTFAARVTASTLSDMYAAVTSAIGTLNGPLHGAANQRAMEMLLEIGEIKNAEAYLADALASGKRIMGFGHRIYKTTADPRVTFLREMLYAVCMELGDLHFYDLSVAVDAIVRRRKGLYPNVDFYVAPLLYTLGIPVKMFPAVFAASRVAGWAAHVMEQHSNNRLLRPLAQYVGALDRSYVPLERRNGRVVSLKMGAER